MKTIVYYCSETWKVYDRNHSMILLGLKHYENRYTEPALNV